MKKGFSLAEILITLAIIGVVAALTIPTMMQKNFEKRTVTQLRVTHSILSQALRMAEEEYGTMDCWVEKPKEDADTAIAFAEKLKPFLKVAIDCGITDFNGKCIYNGTYKLKNNSNSMNYSKENFYYKLKLLNGSAIWLRGNDSNNSWYNRKGVATIFVDTNGNAAPNQWGKDVFSFNYFPSVGLIAGGTLGSNHDYKNHCLAKASSGWGCTYYVLNFQNMNYLHTKK